LGKLRLLLLVFGIAISVIISGCSSSSKTIRYGKKETKQEEKKPVRYTSKEKNEKADTNEELVLPDDYESDPDDEPEDVNGVDISVLTQKYHSSETNPELTTGQVTTREMMMMEIIKYMNTPYKFGGNSKSGIDCSAFTQTIYSNALSIDLLRSAREQYKQGIIVDKIEDLKFGDLVFFNTRKRVKPGHVGIYIGDNLFVHASTKKGVIVTSLSHDYYTKRYMGARRIENNGLF
jgi:cell wall-associated NlpC family hydrolase